jgi:two-component system, chemotaxis family, protein-glutamate methylesterase/glutaminase
MRSMVVIGGSAGALSVLRTVLAGLPAGFPLPLCIVLHIGRHRSSYDELLDRAGPLRVVFAREGDEPQAGTAYLAPPDHHLLIRADRLHLSQGPRENFARPAIDPLFRSAAQACGTGAIGVLLSGRLNDGSAGLYELKQQGGIALVQDPATADHPDMPSNALAHIAVDYRLTPEEIAARLVALASRNPAGPSSAPEWQEESTMASAEFARPVAITCPECGGAMRRHDAGTLVGYECHIGHRFTGEAVAMQQDGVFEHHMEAALRLANERAELCRVMAAQARARGEDSAANWEALAREALERRLLLSKWLGRAPDDDADVAA